MTDAASLQRTAKNFAINQIGTATNYAVQLFILINRLLEERLIEEPPFDPDVNAGRYPLVDRTTIRMADAGLRFPDPGKLAPPVWPRIPADPIHGMNLHPPDQPMLEPLHFDGIRPKPPDAVRQMRAAWASAPETIKAAIGNAVYDWLAQYSPEYAQALMTLEDALARVIMDVGTGPEAGMMDAIEQSVWVKASQQTDREGRAAQRQALAEAGRKGYRQPQGRPLAGLLGVMRDESDRRAAGISAAAIERLKLEVHHLETVLTVSTELHDRMTQAFLTFAGLVGGACGQAAQWAGDVGKESLAQTQSDVTVYKAWLDKYEADGNANRNRAEIYAALMSAYKAEIGAALKSLTAELEVYRSQMGLAKAERSAAVAQFKAAMRQDGMRAKLWTTQWDIRTQTPRAALQQGELEIEKARIPYEGALKLRETEARLEESAYEAACAAALGLYQAFATIASAAESAVDGIGVESETSTV